VKKPSKTVTSIGVVAFIIAAAITGLAGISGTAWSGYDRMLLLFFGIFIGVFVLGWVLDRAAKNAAGGGR
jgi:asparagine N-glycosylation enzyme membrane subunit Stt3